MPPGRVAGERPVVEAQEIFHGNGGHGFCQGAKGVDVRFPVGHHGHDGDGAEAQQGKDADGKPQAVRQLDQDTVPFFNTQAAQAVGKGCRLDIQLGIAQTTVAFHNGNAAALGHRPLSQVV